MILILKVLYRVIKELMSMLFAGKKTFCGLWQVHSGLVSLYVYVYVVKVSFKLCDVAYITFVTTELGFIVCIKKWFKS